MTFIMTSVYNDHSIRHNNHTVDLHGSFKKYFGLVDNNPNIRDGGYEKRLKG